MDGAFALRGQFAVERITERWGEELSLWRGEPLKGVDPGFVVSDGAEDVMDKGGVGAIGNWCVTVVTVASILMKGEALSAEVKAIFGITLEADE